MSIAFTAVVCALLYLAASGLQLLSISQQRGQTSRTVIDLGLAALAGHAIVAYDSVVSDDEANNGLANTAGSIAMARTMAPHSATAQFFINVKDNDFLDHSSETAQGWGYCVFGKVTSGMDVVEKIRAVETTSRAGHSDVPAEPVVIEKAEIGA